MANGIAVVLMAFLCLSSVVLVRGLQGNAVFYDPPYLPSKCYGKANNGNMVAGVSDELWGNGAACGTRYRVTCIRGANQAPHPCKSGSVVVKVVDYCRPRCNGIINLSRDAFSVIADPNAGKVVVQFDRV